MQLSRHRSPLSLTLACALGTFLFSIDAWAGLAACGNIDVEAQAECHADVQGGCEVECEEVSFKAACSGQLYVQCENEGCDADIQAECDLSGCEADCTADCDIDPGKFDCKGSCTGKCEAQCGAHCEAEAASSCEGDGGGCEAEAKAQCEASCSATCEGECSASCDVTPPKADCQAKCQASCSGECKATANIDCQVNCQVDRFGQCEADLQLDCKGQCRKPEGAIFCDGEYVDHGGNFEECVSALNAVLSAAVDVDASGSADANCDNGKCEANAEGKASVSCATSEPGNSRPSGWLWGLGLLGLAATRRRRWTTAQPK